MSVTSVLCNLQCQIASCATNRIYIRKYGDFRNKGKSSKEMRLLYNMIEWNNLDEDDTCIDNCDFNEKLEDYGLRLN